MVANQQADHAKKSGALTIAICFLIAVIEGIDIQVAGVVASGIKDSFGLSASQLGVFFSAGIIGLLPGSFFGGRYADKVGRKTVLVWSVAIFAVFTLATVWAQNYTQLLILRFLAGAGLGAAMPNLIALATESVEERFRGRAVCLMYCGMPLGAVFISYISTLGAGPTEWKTAFMVGGLLPILILPIMIKFLPESREFLAMKEVQQAPAKVSELFSADNRARTLLLWGSYFFTLMVVYIMMNWLPSLFTELGFTRKDGSTAQMYFQAGAFIGTIVLGVLVDRINKGFVVVLMYAGILAGLLCLNSSSSLMGLFLSCALLGTFTIGGQGVLYALASIVYPTQVRGLGVGSAAAVGRIGAMLGPMIAGQLLASGAGAAGVISAAVPGIILAALMMLWVVTRGAKKVA